MSDEKYKVGDKVIAIVDLYAVKKGNCYIISKVQHKNSTQWYSFLTEEGHSVDGGYLDNIFTKKPKVASVLGYNKDKLFVMQRALDSAMDYLCEKFGVQWSEEDEEWIGGDDTEDAKEITQLDNIYGLLVKAINQCIDVEKEAMDTKEPAWFNGEEV